MRMMRFLRTLLLVLGVPAAHADKPTPRLAMVLLEKATLPKGAEVAAAYRTLAGEQVKLVETTEALTLHHADGGFVIVSLMPAPVPGGEAESNHEHSVSRGTKDKLSPHQAHLIVIDSPGEKSKATRERLIRFTYLLAAIVEATRAVGVYWGDAGATHTSVLLPRGGAAARSRSHDAALDRDRDRADRGAGQSAQPGDEASARDPRAALDRAARAQR
jgi:hypothetical protein